MNTVIRDNGENVNKVCDPSKQKEVSKESTETFTIVECNTKTERPPCKYKGTTYTAKIKITCIDGKPSFYAGSTEKKKV